MIRPLLATLTLCIATPAAAQTVEIGSGEWSKVPRVAPQSGWLPAEFISRRIEQAVATGGCPGFGHKNRVTLNVPFVVQFDESKQAKRIVVRDVSCPRLESALADLALATVKAGGLRMSDVTRAGWYRSELSYRYE
jgi:hypothetical protein